MTAVARSVLEVAWTGGFVAGLNFYGLRHPDRKTSPVFPMLWGPATPQTEFRLHGPGWEVPMWTVRIDQWPDQIMLDQLVDSTLRAFLDVGCVVAWAADELGFVSPPELFDPDKMRDGVFVALSRDTGLLGRIVLDEPLHPVEPADLRRLRNLTKGLSDAPAW